MTPYYGMAGLYGKGLEKEDGFALKEAPSDRFSRIVKAVHRQFKLFIHLTFWNDSPN